MNFFGLVWLVSMENNLLADQHLSRRWQSTPSAQQTVRFAPPQFADELATSLPTSAAARTEAATRPVVAQTNAAMTQRPRPSQQSEAILQSKAADVAQKVTTALEQSSFETVKQDKKPQRSYLSSHLDLLSSAFSIATHHSEKLGLNVDASSQAWLDQSQGWLSATGDLVLESTQALVQPQDLAGSFDDEQAGAKEDSDRPDSSAPISARSKPNAESEANATTIRSFPVEAQSPSEGQTSKTADKPAVDPRSKVSTNVAGDAEVKIAAVTVAEAHAYVRERVQAWMEEPVSLGEAPLDKLIESIGLPFARCADDFLIVAKTKAEATEAMRQVEAFVECQLRLLVNRDKSKVAPLKECAFLGFQIIGKQVRRTEKAADRFKQRIREITSRSKGISMSQRLGELFRYCNGWFHYFKEGLRYAETLQWDQWIRRRVRLCYWKQWKLPRKRRRMLIQLGVDPDKVKLASRSRKGYWRLSNNSLVRAALNDDYLEPARKG